MVNPVPKLPQAELLFRIQALMFLRVIFVSILLGASIFIQVKETQTYFGYIQTSHFLLLGTVYFLTFIYVIILKHAKDLLWFAYLQLLVDTLFVTAIIYATGGIDSIFSFLYILTIINGSIILYRKGGMLIASSSSILYGLLLDLHYYNIIQPLGIRGTYSTEYQAFHLFYVIFVNIAGFYLVAFLSSYLSEQTRKSRVELKEKQIDIDKLEILNESIIESITSGLIALDGHNRIILFNPAAEEVFGIKAALASGQRIDHVFPFLSDYFTEGRSTSMKTTEKTPPFVDLPYLKPDGDKTHLRLSISPLRIPVGNEKGFILIFQDVTEIKKIEEEMKKVEGLAIIGELAAGVAHEIRNPMASISGSIQMLAEGLEKDNVNRQLMDIVSREINRLNHLVNDFLLFARPKKANLQEFDLNQLILESLELFQNSQHWTKKTKLVADFRHDIRLESDPEQIKQVLWNLFLNAQEAMPDGGSLHVAIELNSDETYTDHKRVKIVVRDTGNGFDEKALSQIFTPFFTTKEGGSGLGLATVKRIVEGLKGEVSGSNHPEGGARIIILLPESPS
ncbi:MAG: PAS domain S-box protein [Desulfobacteraceae bacterium]|nr:PAS domain S-box protein [Desulfobacteraceae bacterium]